MANDTNEKYTIFYADDDEDDLFLIKDAFEKYHQYVNVVTATDGQEMLRHLQQLPADAPSPCLIILDINMPRLNGKETLKAIRSMQRFEKTPVVLFTTSSFPVDREFAEKYNAGFVSKPFTMQQIQ
jgi:CheY-like chemotaxis protein